MTIPRTTANDEPSRPGLLRQIDTAVELLQNNKRRWRELSVKERIVYLDDIRTRIPRVASAWVQAAVAGKQIGHAPALAGEEWMSGPWALLRAVKQLIATLRRIDAGTHNDLSGFRQRRSISGQAVVEVFPRTLFDRLLISGVRAEVWMQPGAASNAVASHYAPENRRGQGEVALVLGAGNIASIAPLDSLHKLYTDLAVVALKLNPVNDYLGPFIEKIFDRLIEDGFMRVLYGGAEAGAALCAHPGIDTIHITGSAATHDAIVFGAQKQGNAPRRRINTRPVTSELGGVSPIIVVPGPWTRSDIDFQARNIATQRLHNGGFNCIASQILVLPQGWEHTARLEPAVTRAIAEAADRPPYYPGTEQRKARFLEHYAGKVSPVSRPLGLDQILIPLDPEQSRQDQMVYREEAFAPVLGIPHLPYSDERDFLHRAVDFCNERLAGTLGANILIHPDTLSMLGPAFEEELARLRYGCIAVNLWTGGGFLLTETSWGAFPGHVMEDVQSDIGTVHNTMMFDHPEKSVVYGPFRPFPRSILAGQPSLLPMPPWFVSHRSADKVAKRLFEFEAEPSWLKLPAIMWHAMRA